MIYRVADHDPSPIRVYNNEGLPKSPNSKENETATREICSSSSSHIKGQDSFMGKASLETPKLIYPIRYFLQHLNRGYPDIVEELCEEDLEFWCGQSTIREKWFEDLQEMTNGFGRPDLVNLGRMSALHIAAALDTRDLVAKLIRKFDLDTATAWDDENATALHIAAYTGSYDTVCELIRWGADIDLEYRDVGTPLHLAALCGHTSIVELLLEQGAHVNAISKAIGPVINAAVRSGNIDMISLIMAQDVHFDIDPTISDPPLCLSASTVEPSLFKEILRLSSSKWSQSPDLLHGPLVAAAYCGCYQNLCLLLGLDYTWTGNILEAALHSSVCGADWRSADKLLDYINDVALERQESLKLDEIFLTAAKSQKESLPILQRIWSLTGQKVGRDVLESSLYEATALNKGSTVDWLHQVCGTRQPS